MNEDFFDVALKEFNKKNKAKPSGAKPKAEAGRAVSAKLKPPAIASSLQKRLESSLSNKLSNKCSAPLEADHEDKTADFSEIAEALGLTDLQAALVLGEVLAKPRFKK